MKRQQEIAPGVFRYSTGQVGTADLPQFVAECAYHKPKTSKRQDMHMRNIRVPSDHRMPWRGQLARAYAQLLTAKKRQH